MGGLAAAYLLIQLTLPPVLLASRASRSTDFSWDMFSHGLRCSNFDAVARVHAVDAREGAPWGSVRLDVDFGSWAQASRVLVPSRLEIYASWLCSKLRAEEGQPVELRFVAACIDDRDHAALGWLDPNRDFCAARP